VDRLACVSLPWFPLQILLQRQPEWRSFPVAVISRDEPSGELLWVNDAAWKSRVRPGLSYSAALSICRELRAAEVGAELIEQQIVALAKQLKKFSPAVEASREQPGIFWIDASGLQHLYPDLETWGAALQKELHLHQFLCNVVIGFGRFSSYALACSNHRAEVTVLPDRAQEQSSAAEVPLERLGISSSVRRSMNDLAIVTVGQFLALPLASVRRRFGIDAARLRDVAEERGWTPFSCEPDREPASRSIVLEDAISHTEPVLFLARGCSIRCSKS
jgi:protein ImuB